jgi:eukaryotic-like serine/threonine-protein kinase
MTAAVREGDIIAQRYRIKRMLGVGGMGVVMEATHIELNERVAIKLLLPELTNNAEASERFKREARAVAKLKSEHVARVFDVGKLDDDTPFMVMEYLEGETLAAKLDQMGRLPIGDSVDYILQACRALSAAHDKGIVHRDLKPSNLFLAAQDDNSLVLKVLDFGISKLNSLGGPNDGSITKTSAVMGSPNYMSPEQMRSTRTVDGRSDIWSLGVTLYELIAGTPPFVGQTFPEVCLAIAQDTPAPLSKHVPDLSPGLEAVIHRCLEKDPDRRFAKVSELARALMPFAPHAGRSAMRWSITNESSSLPRIETAQTAPSLVPVEPPSNTTGPTPPVVARTGSAWGNTHQWQDTAPAAPPRRSRVSVFVVAMTLVGATLGTGLAWYVSRRDPTAPLPAVSASVARGNDASAEAPPAPPPSTPSSPPSSALPFASSLPTAEPAGGEPPSTALPSASTKPPPTITLARPPTTPVRPPPPRPPTPPPIKTSASPSTPPKPPEPPSSPDLFGGRK